MFNDIYGGKKILVTGFAGVKGSWLCLWLRRLGAEVIGYGHQPSTSPNHHDLLGIAVPDSGTNLLDYTRLSLVMADMQPDLIFHLASKTVVNLSFEQPREYF